MHLKIVPVVMLDDEPWFEETESGMKLTPVALSEDGWVCETEVQPRPRFSDIREVSMYPGDLVLYRFEGNLVPAALIELDADGRWLARDSRHGRNLFVLAPEDIATRMPRRD